MVFQNKKKNRTFPSVIFFIYEHLLILTNKVLMADRLSSTQSVIDEITNGKSNEKYTKIDTRTIIHY